MKKFHQILHLKYQKVRENNMNFEYIKKIVNKEGKVIIIDNSETYVVSKYIEDIQEEEKPITEVNGELAEENEEESLDIEDLPF